MKKFPVALLIFFSTAISLLCGCDRVPPPGPPVKLVVLLGAHSNSKTFDRKDMLTQQFTTAYSSLGGIRVVAIDGTPDVSLDESGQAVGAPDKDKFAAFKLNRDVYTVSQLDQQLKPFVDTAYLQIEKLHPDCDEFDTLMAFWKSEAAFSSIYTDASDKTTPKKIIIIIDTGLSTSGALNFVNADYLSLAEAEINTLINGLSAANELPDLNGVDVFWYGIGAVASPQKKLSNGQIEKLKDIWEALIKKAGGYVEFYPLVETGDEKQDYTVSVVRLPATQESPTPTTMSPPSPHPSRSNTPTSVYFHYETTNYSDSPQALKDLEYVAKQIESNPGEKWWIIGCTATTEKRLSVSDILRSRDTNTPHLSIKRVNAVLRYFEELGIPKSRFILSAQGASDPWHVSDTVDTGAMQENRRVILVRDSDIASNEDRAKLELGVFE